MQETLVGALWEIGATGLEELDSGTWRAYFDRAPGPTQLVRLAEAGATSVSPEVVPGRDWVLLSQRRSRAVRVGPLLIRPPWSRAVPRSGQSAIEIEPARAFGTGSHQTTRLVLRDLVADPPVGSRVLDVGCGTGILSLAAARLGAADVVAIDIDAEATAATRDNWTLNGLAAERLSVIQGGVDGVCRPFDLVLANLTRDLLEQCAEQLWTAVDRHGFLVVSGFLRSDVQALSKRFEALSARRIRSRRAGEWAALRFCREAPHG